MLVRKPRGGYGPFSVGLALILGTGAGVYIWGPALHQYLNTDPEVLAYRKKAQLEREIEKTTKVTSANLVSCGQEQLSSAMLALRNALVQSRRLASTGHGPKGPPTNVHTLKALAPSAIGYGAAAAALGLYFTDWKLVLQYLPFYSGKFEE